MTVSKVQDTKEVKQIPFLPFVRPFYRDIQEHLQKDVYQGIITPHLYFQIRNDLLNIFREQHNNI